MRGDGSSKFRPGDQWAYFPSAAFAWRASDEKWVKAWGVFSNLKVRASLGASGNDRIASDLWRQSYELATSNSIAFSEIATTYYKFSSTMLANPTLKWETTITRNIGLDLGFFDQRLTATIEFYKNTTKDLLVKSVIPGQTGFTEMMDNIGKTQNRGFEMMVEGIIIDKKDFTLRASANISVNRNKVISLDGDSRKFYRSNWISTELKEADDYLVQVGQPVGLMYGYVTDGFYTFDDFTAVQNANSSWSYQLNAEVANNQSITRPRFFGPGALKLKKTTPGDDYIISPEDRQVIGNANPKHTGGFNIMASYKGFDLSAFFNWSYGNDIYNANKILFTTSWKYQYYNLIDEVSSNRSFQYFDDNGARMTTGDPEALKARNAHATIWSPHFDSPVFHSWAVEDGSFLRFSNLTIGYTFPQKWSRKIGISQLRIYGTANNIYTWTKYTGYDPEVDAIRSTPMTPGVDFSAYPKSKGFTFGTNITF